MFAPSPPRETSRQKPRPTPRRRPVWPLGPARRTPPQCGRTVILTPRPSSPRDPRATCRGAGNRIESGSQPRTGCAVGHLPALPGASPRISVAGRSTLAPALVRAYLGGWRVLLFSCEALFPVADKHFRGGWLCRGPGPGIWRPPDMSGSRETHVFTVAAVPATFPARIALIVRPARGWT